jgi:hypothetical protein
MLELTAAAGQSGWFHRPDTDCRQMYFSQLSSFVESFFKM